MGNKTYSSEQVKELTDAMYTCMEFIERLKANEDIQRVFSAVREQASSRAKLMGMELPNQEEDQRKGGKSKRDIYTLITSEPKYRAALQTLGGFRNEVEAAGSLADKVHQLAPDLIAQCSENPET